MRKIVIVFAVLCASVFAHATVTSTATSATFTCTGATGPYPFTFSVSSVSAIQVSQAAPGASAVILTPTSQWNATPTNNSYSNGGSVTLVTACPATYTLVVQRVTPLTQTTAFTQYMPALYANIESSLDKLMEIDQEQYATLWVKPIYSPTAPSGSCSPNNQVEYVTGSTPYIQYICSSGTWVQSGGGTGGGGAVVAPPANCIQLANTAATALACDPEFAENPITHTLTLGTGADSCTGASCITLANGNGTFGGVLSAATAVATNSASIGPRYDVTQFGAVGNGVTDDTAAIQAAYYTCWNGGTGPYGGVVEFPGTKTYVISSTINVYDQCKQEGQETNGYSNGSVQIRWNGPAAGATFSITGFTTQANNSSTLPCGGAICATASAPVIPNPYAIRYSPYVATLSTASTTGLAVNQWVSITGCSTTQGVSLNNLVTQVAAVSTSSFTVVVPWGLTNLGTYTDTCTATTTNVAFATDTNARYNEEFRNLAVLNESGLPAANGLGVDFYFNDRVDTGTRIYNTQAASASLYGYYFANGGINSSFNGGWRCDGVQKACIYWRPASNDNLGIEDGTVDNNLGSQTAQSGGIIFVDNASCSTGAGGNLRLSMRHVNFESNSSVASGLGAFTLLSGNTTTCGGYWSYNVNPQLLLSLDNVIMNMASSVTTGSAIVVSPANDAAISMHLSNVQFSGNSVSGPRFVGLPALSRMDNVGYFGNYPNFSYSLGIRTIGFGGGLTQYRTQMGSAGDSIVDNLYQKGVFASPFMFSDVAFAALPNGTILYPGQIIAPPTYWTTGSATSGRYALQVVQQTGTTGSPNAGATTCSIAASTSYATCTSAADLSPGQHVTIGSKANLTVLYIDATNPSAVVVNFTAGAGAAQTNAALSFSAPVLGLEMQMPTKCSVAPTTGTWAQGDYCENSGAATNGIAGWVNVVAGTPGTWAAIPLGTSSGQIAATQIAPASLQGTDTKLLSAGTVSGTGIPLCTDANGGATTTGCPGVGSVVSINVTGLTSATGGIIYAIPSTAAGWYNVACYPVVTTAATTSSALPYCTISYTDEDSGAAAITSTGGTQMIATTSSTQNLPGTTGIGHGYSGNLLIHAAASTNITYTTTSYVSSGATPMAYALHLTAQYVGP